MIDQNRNFIVRPFNELTEEEQAMDIVCSVDGYLVLSRTPTEMTELELAQFIADNLELSVDLSTACIRLDEYKDALEAVISAAENLFRYRVGDMPQRGYFTDSLASRKAIVVLVGAISVAKIKFEQSSNQPKEESHAVS